MSETSGQPPSGSPEWEQPQGQQWLPPAPPGPAGPMSPYGAVGVPGGSIGPIGRQRGTGLSIVLFIVTLGIYGYVWIFQVHEEMKRHTNDGLGGGISLLLWFFLGTLAMGFLTPLEVARPLRAAWPETPGHRSDRALGDRGILLCGVGPIVWFVQTNNALNDYWRSLGAPNP